MASRPWRSDAVAQRQARGLQVVTQKDGPFVTAITFRHLKPARGPRWWAAASILALLLVAGVVVVVPPGPFKGETYERELADAASAIETLNDGDLAATEQQLAANRGNPDFAYFFTSQVTPRSLGDALGTFGGEGEEVPFETGEGAEAYELVLTDLAGVTSLATHGTGDRALPASWTSEFATATTDPTRLYGTISRSSSEEETLRVHQDAANKQNLLLLLSRGYWSTDFLMEVTTAYWEFDRDNPGTGWPGATLDDAKYAPAPNGGFLTDGVLALTAALTANPAASAWAFTDFQPGRQPIDGSDSAIGKFTHYLLFEHQFPETADAESIGMTATLTALSSAVDANGGASAIPDGLQAALIWDWPDQLGPLRDALILRSLAREATGENGCSWDPRDYWKCAKAAGEAVLHWVQRWGHSVLDVLSLATFAGPPFTVVGVAAAATNATWYAIEGDYAMAGLSLAVVVPALAFVKIAKGVKTAVVAEKGAKAATQVEQAAKRSADVAKRASLWRPKPWRDCNAVGAGGLSLRYGNGWTKAQRRAAEEKVKAYYDAARRGELRKTVSQRSGTSAGSRYKKEGRTVPDGSEVDHTIDLQLGGGDEIHNMKPLDATVNKSLGKQVERRLNALPVGQVIPAAAIC